MSQSSPLLEVDELSVEFHTPKGVLGAVESVSFAVAKSETLAIVGETGSGKTVSAHAIMGILDIPPARIAGGSVRYLGLDVLTLPESQLRGLRGREMAIVFQDPLTALNPLIRVGDQVAEMFTVRLGLSRQTARVRAVGMLERARIPSAGEVARRYPHELSGGMRQRVVIAMALSLGPKLLIADEPTTALDVSIQAQIMDLLATLRDETGMGLLLITHDLGLVAQFADRAVVMYAGRVAETGPVAELYRRPAHPYTLALMATVPRADQKGHRLNAIPGAHPDGLAMPSGCRFHPRCPWARPVCRAQQPPLHSVAPGRASACHFFEQVVSAR